MRWLSLKRYLIILVLIFIILILGCNKSQSNEYGFIHCETTGITSYIVDEGEEIPIKFHKDSNQLAVKSLYGLKWNILYANSDGKTIYLVGELYNKKHHTPTQSNMATSEEYYEFKLIKWYILTPFKEIIEGDTPLDRELALTQRKHLKPEDFNDFIGKDKMTYNLYEKNRK
jgi:hypothetical protein